MASSETTVRFRCSFCLKSEHQVELLIAGPASVYVCGECVATCNRIIEELRRKAG